ncbi:MAG: hypothetical protein IJL78_02610 [Lachnospiraceae bacterium]|nr:hypothetical protein [Lachnospiraceae bacterium]
MKNLMSSYLYRFLKQPSTWIFMALTAINTAIACFSTGVMFGDAPWVAEIFTATSDLMQQNGVDFSGIVNVLSDEVRSIYDYTSFSMLAGTGLFLNPPVLMVFFITAYTLREKTYGYAKNLLPLFSRNKLETANLLMILLYSVCVTLVSAAVSLLMYRVFFVNPSGDASFGRFLMFLLIEAVLIFVLGVFIEILSELFRRPFTGVIVSLLYFTLGSSFIYSILNSLFSGIFRRNVTVQSVTPFGCLSSFLYSDSGSFLRCGIVAFMFAVLFILIRFYVVKNKMLKDTI